MIQPPPDWIIRAFYSQLVELVNGAVAAYSEIPFSITSWWRSPARNAKAGGAEFSQHLVGLALDATAADLGRLDRALKRQGFVTVPYGTHVHAQVWRAGKLEELIRGA